MTSGQGSFWSRLRIVVRPFFRSEVRWRAAALLALILAFIVGLNGLNILGSYACRDFTTAVAERHASDATKNALRWAAVFSALTLVAVFKAFTEDRLRLWWRQWLTQHLIGRYLLGRAYHHLRSRHDVDNPDQRITEDVRAFTEHALAFLLILTNSILTLVAFSAVLWSITPMLFGAAVGYALLGTGMTVLLGRRLVGLDVAQFRKEADLRYDLIQVRTQSEPIALLQGEADEARRLERRLGDVVQNMKGIIGLSRNIGFFTTGYDYLIQLLPLLIVAPLYMAGSVEFGMMLQAQIAFMHVMGAFSLIVKEFQRISAFGAVTERLGRFCEALTEQAECEAKAPIEVSETPGRLAFSELTLVTPREGRSLIEGLSLELKRGQRLLIAGPSGSGRTTLLRATAGLWSAGSGRIARPPLPDVFFLPQQPYTRRGTLREQIVYGLDAPVTDARLRLMLRKVGLEALLAQANGLDAVHDWNQTLSLGEQQRLAIARLLVAAPAFAFLDEPTSALSDDDAERLYRLLFRAPITYITTARDLRLRAFHDRVVEIAADGSWHADGDTEAGDAPARLITAVHAETTAQLANPTCDRKPGVRQSQAS